MDMVKLGFLGKNAGPFLIIALIIIGIVIALVIGGSDKSKPKPQSNNSATVNTSCGPYRKEGIVTIGSHEINVETAAGAKELAEGLSGRPCIAANWGMLFDFGHDGRYAIWMKDMKFPIDVIWISSSHKIAAIEIDFQPSTYNKQKPDQSERRENQIPARYVLEVKANLSKDLNLSLGQSVQFHKNQST
jgi:uncharacterized membrane protein (UPF0127 family)